MARTSSSTNPIDYRRRLIDSLRDAEDRAGVPHAGTNSMNVDVILKRIAKLEEMD